MRFTFLLTGLATVTVVSSLTISPNSFGLIGGGDPSTSDHRFGASIPPWNSGAHPGWYFGKDFDRHPDLFGFTPSTCRILDAVTIGLRCPRGLPLAPFHGYLETFSNLNGATQASDYITFGLVDTIAHCISMCNNVQGCGFVNTYHDVNGKKGSPLLTCSLFKKCHNASDATNHGGQNRDQITKSYGWCKKVELRN
ncbi:hypothetical protein M378DRAFT_969176 [Amanita muscaria Koide BX008]|uniref:Uncharacterized protein n=1 Tax=Amanita muscaria (strain Koide BX008) TaxID=946122 RepID=A0A0C2WTZ6_AMAMK|nr:hypothetical protein M378DRAFT_969176 [Amanita muscaria Koide BX008]